VDATIGGKRLDLSGRPLPVWAWALRKPLIAATNGACAGIGLVQALLCDVRFCRLRGAFRHLWGARTGS
jgi:hypothetical protein